MRQSTGLVVRGDASPVDQSPVFRGDQARIRNCRPVGGRLTWLVVIAVWAGLWAAGGAVLAGSGSERTIQGDDFRMVVDHRWAGGAYGGYLPVRVTITNFGAARDVTLRFRPDGGGGPAGNLPAVTRTVRSETNSTQRVTLSIPLTAPTGGGEFLVYANGQLLERFVHRLNLPDFSSSSQKRPSLVIVSPVNVDATLFEAAAQVQWGSGSGGYSAYGSVRAEDHMVLPPDAMPEKWIDYTAIDYLALSMDTLAGLPEATRTAILDWTAAGGCLLVTEVTGRISELDQLLGRANRSLLSEWTFEEPSERQPIAAPTVPGTTPTATAPTPPMKPWPKGERDYGRASLGLGSVHAFQFDAFPGSQGNWCWFFQNTDAASQTLGVRLGTCGREQGHPEFYHFLIPGVGAAPITMFLVLITGFSIVIGPINLWWLARRKQLHLMLLTIPLISLLTCLSLFAYAILADGFGVQSRQRSLTLVDQSAARAVTSSRVSLYAGLSPGGLSFSPVTAIFPVWPEDPSQSRLSVDWTETQRLQGGWLPARTPTQFVTVSVQPQRERLNVASAPGGLRVENGFSIGLRELIVWDDKGKAYYADRLPAGSSATLAPITDANWTECQKQFSQSLPALPKGVDSGDSMSFGGAFRQSYRYMYGMSSVSSFSPSQVEQRLYSPWKVKSSLEPATPRMYWGLFDANPGISPGLDGTEEQASMHFVNGKY